MEAGLGAFVRSITPGRAILDVELIPARLDAWGQPIMAVLSCLADTAIGISVLTSFPVPTGGSTLEMRIDRGLPLGPGAASLRIESTSDYLGRAHGRGQATFTDDTGMVVAYGVATMAVSEEEGGRPAGAGGERAGGSDGRSAGEGGGAVGAAGLFDPVALAASDAWQSDDPSEVLLPLDATMSNPRRQVHGGVLLAIADLAQRRLHPAGAGVITTSIEYIRPAPSEGQLRITSTTLRSGRRFSTVRSELRRPDGKVAAVATGIAALATE